jgi:PAS domain S-box-containing protein
MPSTNGLAPCNAPADDAGLDGHASFDRALRFVEVDATFVARAGLPADRLREQPLAEALPAWEPALAPALRRVIATAAPTLNLVLPPGPADAGGTRQRHVASLYPVLSRGGAVLGVELILHDAAPPHAPALPVPWPEVVTALDSMPVGLALFDGPSLCVRWANPAYQRFLEGSFQTESLVGRRLEEFIPHAESSGVAATFRRVAATGESFTTPEFRHEGFARGTTFWRWSLVPLPRAGAAFDLLLVVAEITEQVLLRQEAEGLAVALERERAQLVAILDQLPVGLYLAEAPGGRIMRHNAAAVRLLRHPLLPADTTDEYARYGILTPDGQPYPGEQYPLARAVRGETVEATSLLYRRGDGTLTRIEISAAPVRGPDGAIAFAVATFQDVSAREELHTQLQQQALLLDQAHEAMLGWELAGPITFWNRGAEELYGFSRAEAIGQVAPQFLGSVHARPEEVIEAELVANGQWQGEVQHTTKDGRKILVESRQTLVTDAAGRRLVLEANRDITARRLAEAEREALLARERDAVEARDSFIAIASHDLRSPLTALLGQAELLARRAAREGLPERIARSAQAIAEQARRMNRMLGALLDLSRIQSGQIELSRTQLDLAALVARCAAELEPTLTTHTLRLEGPDEGLWVLGDEVRLEQVIINLLGNAVKYSPDGGTVTLRVERQDDQACVVVADRGIGIPAEALPRLFERFYRGPNAAMNGIGGLGIGLYAVREILALHGGSIHVDSEPGRGSTFTACLPLAP